MVSNGNVASGTCRADEQSILLSAKAAQPSSTADSQCRSTTCLSTNGV